MEDSFKTIVERSKSILILLPQKPYFDQVAAGLSLYLTLSGNKPTAIATSSSMTVEFNRLVGVNKITSELGNKNLVIRFKDYLASDIERVSYDIEDGQFKLTVIPKSGILAPVKDQVNITYAGGSSDLIILVGGMNDSHFPQLQNKDLETAELVHVGNKQLTLTTNRSCLSFSKPSPSTSEVAYELLIGNGFKVQEDAATNLIMGIEDATDNYAVEGVTADTFAIVSELMQLGGKRMPKSVGGSYPPGSIPGNLSQRKGLVPEKHEEEDKKKYSSNPFSSDTENQTNSNSTMSQDVSERSDDESNDQPEETPQEWLQQPKVYKGTSVS
jgi:hypothetical protein